MGNAEQAIEQFCSYFTRETEEIARLAVSPIDGNGEASAARRLLYGKVLYLTMLDTLAGVRFHKKSYPDLSKQNRARFTRFVIDHCSWAEAELVSLPFLLEKHAELKLEMLPLGQHVSDRLAQFSTQNGGTLAVSKLDEQASELLARASCEKEEAAIHEYQHLALLYRYRNRLIHESRQPGYAMEVFAESAAPYYHGYLGERSWYLGYPLAMFEHLLRNAIDSFRSHLVANSINPYSLLDNAQRW